VEPESLKHRAPKRFECHHNFSLCLERFVIAAAHSMLLWCRAHRICPLTSAVRERAVAKVHGTFYYSQSSSRRWYRYGFCWSAECGLYMYYSILNTQGNSISFGETALQHVHSFQASSWQCRYSFRPSRSQCLSATFSCGASGRLGEFSMRRQSRGLERTFEAHSAVCLTFCCMSERQLSQSR